MRLIVSLIVCTALTGCSQKRTPQPVVTGEAQVLLKNGLGMIRHPIATNNPEAQAFFDQGMAQYYGFNHHEALRSFKRVAEIDPGCAMAYWGQAMALGPNINVPIMTPDAERQAAEAVTMAQARFHRASPKEQSYISALSKRYSADQSGDSRARATEYALAMDAITVQFPSDLDAWTLAAEAWMDLHPWKLYASDGTPGEDTAHVVEMLETVLKKDPNHIGANHLYIHATEASTNPGRAMESAKRLPKLAANSGHLVHMPAHVYMRTGDYASAVTINQNAATVDEEYISCCHPVGLYPMLYYNHNVHFLYIAACFTGQSKLSVESADKVSESAGKVALEAPLIEPFVASALLARIRFGQWDAIREIPQPDPRLKVTSIVWHFAQGLAAIDKGEIDSAKEHLVQLRTLREALPPECVAGQNKAQNVLAPAEYVLAGRIEAAGENSAGALDAFRAAVAAQDALSYDEPPFIPIPARETLGSALLQGKDFAAAEQVFRDDLVRNPRNPRSLFGLSQALKAQNKDAGSVEAELKEVWKDADVEIQL